MKKNLDKLKKMTLAFAIGDAVGVPYEFSLEGEHDFITINRYDGFMTHNQEPGTWSDDTSMLLCLIDAYFTNSDNHTEYSLKNYSKWLYKDEFTVDNLVFDSGNQTVFALDSHKDGKSIHQLNKFKFNGNGGLMRIFPLAFFCYEMDFNTTLRVVKKECSITHPHEVSVFTSVYFVQFIKEILKTQENKQRVSLKNTHNKVINEMIHNFSFEFEYSELRPLFDGIFVKKNLVKDSTYVDDNGFVVTTLVEALHHVRCCKDFKTLCTKVIYNGGDTDTVLAIASSIFVLINGIDSIPEYFRENLRGLDVINEILTKLD